MLIARRSPPPVGGDYGCPDRLVYKRRLLMFGRSARLGCLWMRLRNGAPPQDVGASSGDPGHRRLALFGQAQQARGYRAPWRDVAAGDFAVLYCSSARVGVIPYAGEC